MKIQKGKFEIHVAREGFGSILHTHSGEIMHSRMRPEEEAMLLYVGQSRLAERLAEPLEEPLILWDVGLGAAANACAAIRKAREVSHGRGLEIHSFEIDMDPLRLALEHPELFPGILPDAARSLLECDSWNEGNIRWSLTRGNFLDDLGEGHPVPEIIFYDMFSPKVARGPWGYATFRRLFQRLARENTGLFTYTRSTAIRAGMLAAGFYLAKGVNAGAKEETTIALTPAAANQGNWDMLDRTWLEKWRKSTAKHPPGSDAATIHAIETAVETHPQFAN